VRGKSSSFTRFNQVESEGESLLFYSVGSSRGRE